MVLEIRNTSIIQVTAKLELERYELDKGLGQFNTDVKTLTIQRCCKSLRGPNTKVAYHVTGTEGESLFCHSQDGSSWTKYQDFRKTSATASKKYKNLISWGMCAVFCVFIICDLARSKQLGRVQQSRLPDSAGERRSKAS